VTSRGRRRSAGGQAARARRQALREVIDFRNRKWVEAHDAGSAAHMAAYDGVTRHTQALLDVTTHEDTNVR
jgi:hypothetical protein